MTTNKVDIILMGDNNLETVGGEQESTKIILEGIKEEYSVGVIQPGMIENPMKNVVYFQLTESTRLKHIIMNPLSFIQYIWKVRKIINSSKPTIIHTQAQVSFFIIALLRKMKLISKNTKLVHTERGLYTKYNRLFKYLFFFFMKELHTLVTTTKFNMKYWKKALENRGLDIEYRIIENTAGKLFERYDEKLDNQSDSYFTIGFSGRYTSWKNWPLAIEICEEISKVIGSNLKVKMAVGSLDKKAELETLKMFKHMKSILGERFEGNMNITLEEMDNFYYDLDVFILTSKRNTESFGRTIVEAMSRKTAVLTTDAGGSVEVVGNNENVCHSLDDFKKRILQFYNNKTCLENEKSLNLQRVKKVYSYQSNIIKHRRLYNSLRGSTYGKLYGEQ